MSTLSRFQSLRVLALASVAGLQVGFRPPKCGNSYMGPRGDQVRQRVKREKQEAESKVAQMVFAVCAHLVELRIGDNTKAEIERSSDGSVKNITMSEGEW